MSRVRYVTAADVMARATDGAVRIGPDERLTALARDEARRVGLCLVEVRAGDEVSDEPGASRFESALRAVPSPSETRSHEVSHGGPDHDVIRVEGSCGASAARLDATVEALVREARIAGGRLVDRRRSAPSGRTILLRFDWSGALPVRRRAFRDRALERLGSSESARAAASAANPRDSGDSAELLHGASVRGGFEG